MAGNSVCYRYLHEKIVRYKFLYLAQMNELIY
jgi:hypothetical protein